MINLKFQSKQVYTFLIDISQRRLNHFVYFECKFYFILLLTRPSQDVILLPLIPCIEQGGSSTLLVKLLYDLCDGHTIFSLNAKSEYNFLILFEC